MTEIHPRPVPIIHIKGSHRDIGRQIGAAFPEKVRHGVENARQFFADTFSQLHLTWEGAQIQSRKYLPFVQERFPQYYEELLGIAEGAGVPLNEIVVLNAMEAVTTDALHLTRCTSMAVAQERSANGHVLLAHNEDWVPEDEDDVYLVHAAPDDEPPFLAMSYGGLLPNIGFNANGIAQLIDTVYPTDARVGVPRIIVGRAVLGSRTPGEAIRAALAAHRAAGYNHLIVHESGEMYNVEVSARRFGVLGGEDGLVAHTNHYLSNHMREIEKEPYELIGTRVRYFRARRLLQGAPAHTVETLQNILRDHVNFPDSICNHAMDGDPLDREKTINALVIDLTERQMYVAWGNPCANQFHTFGLME